MPPIRNSVTWKSTHKVDLIWLKTAETLNTNPLDKILLRCNEMHHVVVIQIKLLTLLALLPRQASKWNEKRTSQDKSSSNNIKSLHLNESFGLHLFPMSQVIFSFKSPYRKNNKSPYKIDRKFEYKHYLRPLSKSACEQPHSLLS